MIFASASRPLLRGIALDESLHRRHAVGRVCRRRKSAGRRRGSDGRDRVELALEFGQRLHRHWRSRSCPDCFVAVEPSMRGFAPSAHPSMWSKERFSIMTTTICFNVSSPRRHRSLHFCGSRMSCAIILARPIDAPSARAHPVLASWYLFLAPRRAVSGIGAMFTGARTSSPSHIQRFIMPRRKPATSVANSNSPWNAPPARPAIVTHLRRSLLAARATERPLSTPRQSHPVMRPSVELEIARRNQRRRTLASPYSRLHPREVHVLTYLQPCAPNSVSAPRVPARVSTSSIRGTRSFCHRSPRACRRRVPSDSLNVFPSAPDDDAREDVHSITLGRLLQQSILLRHSNIRH